MTFAAKLKSVRQTAKITQYEAARLIGCPVATWRDWEQGRHEPPEWLQRIVLERIRGADRS